MAKKKKRRIQAPSLSSLDKGVYWLLIFCSVAAGLILYPMIIGCFRDAVYEDTRILAQNNPSVVILGIFGFALFGGLALMLDWLRRKKLPIFGKAGITYGAPQWKPVYPVFGKQFWKNVVNNKKRLAMTVFAFGVVLILTILLTALMLPVRECLLEDGSIQVYNCFNDISATYDRNDVSQVRFYTRSFYDRGGPDDWAVQMEMAMRDGECFSFSYRNFKTRDENIHGAISGMYRIKTCFHPDLVKLEGKADVPKVIRDMNLNGEETKLLYLLFGIEDAAT